MVRRTSLLCFAVALAVSLSGCCTEQKCIDQFNFTDCTKAECDQKYPPVQGPTGPDIVLGPGGGNVLEWRIDQVPATDSGISIFDTCRLRKDFIGTAILHFDYERKTPTEKRVAEEIQLVSESKGIELTIKRGSSGGLDWWIKSKSLNKSCTLKMGDIPSPVTDVPSEFIGLTHDTGADVFKEVYDNFDAEKIDKIKVTY